MAQLTLGKKIGAGFAVVTALALLIGVVGLVAVRHLTAESNDMTAEVRDLVDATRLQALANEEVADARGYLLTRNPRLLEKIHALDDESTTLLAQRLAQATSAENRKLLEDVQRADKDLSATLDTFMKAHQGDAEAREFARYLERLGSELDKEEAPRVEQLRRAILAYQEHEQRALAEQEKDFQQTTRTTHAWVLIAGLLTLLLGTTAAVYLATTITRSVSAAVSDVQSSSTELQAAATQQAAASKEQAAATNETTTTIKELVATARQIAESAQRVAQIADETASAARSGDQTAQRAQDALGEIRRQVDAVVAHMLELGRKSQQIGGILELINELAEQTNILAINATIEAAGAGDSGKRFGVVADEIRKLADRVGGSAKSIRSLVDEIRTAVNTTVMATEQGSKSVDAGTRQMSDVAAALDRIVNMVGTTTEAAREIELSTRQQTTAVEQVNVAMVDVAQAAKETEATSSQTFQTAAQLTRLSKELGQMVRANGAA